MPLKQQMLDMAHRIDPRGAAILLSDLADLYPKESTQFARAVLLSSAYPALGALLRASPDLLPDSAQPLGLELLQQEQLLLKTKDRAVLRRQLRRFVQGGKIRTALRELLPSAIGGADIETTTRELSDLADFSIRVALSDAMGHVFSRLGTPCTSDGAPSRIAILGMGKLGGRELNAGSDVDLICFYDSDDCVGRSEEGRSYSAHELWTKVVQQMTATLEDVTEDGFVWRVDLRLRPEGSSGPLVNSLAAAERYYENFGRLWERAAMLRARPVAGDLTFGTQVLEMLSPFIWQRRVDPQIAEPMYALVHRARTELSSAPERDLKLGPGGIREAEFFVQTLQLIWGGVTPRLRERPTIKAMMHLRDAGFVTEREARTLENAYALLRRLEHAIQFSSGLQTHSLPVSTEEQERLAAVVGFKDRSALFKDLRSHTRGVSALFASLLPSGEAELSPWAPAFKALDRVDRDAFAIRLAGTPLSPLTEGPDEELVRHLFELSRLPDSPLGTPSRERHRHLAASLLDALAGAADPVMAARHLYGAFSRMAHPGVYVKLLADDPTALRRLVTVLGGSAFIGEAVAARPELVDLVLFRTEKVQPNDARAEVAQTCAQNIDEDDVEQQAGCLRRAKVRITTQVALDDLAGTIDTREATSTLAALADTSLDAATRFALTGRPDGDVKGLSVIAMGKLGGCDIGYGSDLDVIFLFEPTEQIADPVAHYSRKARRIIQLISMPHYEGPGYELDTRLRPSGNQGLLVVSLEAFTRYHQPASPKSTNPKSDAVRGGRAATWERLALLRARAAAGDLDLGAKAIRIAQEAAYESPGDFRQLAADIHHLRSRMERELAQERPGRYDLKFGKGGLVDIEFSVQLLQLKHGANPRVRSTDTLEALAALRDIAALPASQADTLREGYLFLRDVEQRIRVVHGDSTHLLEESAHGLPALARRLQIRDVPRAAAETILLERYRAITTRVRSCYDQLVVAAAQSDTHQTED